MTSALRELAAYLGIEVEGEEKVKKADERVEGLLDKLKSVGEVVAEAFAWDKVKEFIEHQVEAATELERTAQRLGLATEEIETYRFATADAGVATETMDTALRFLNRNIGEAVSKGGEAAAAFQKVGIHVKNTDGTTRDAAEVMADLADHIAKVPDAAEKTRLAMELLGRQGASLIPVLNKGSEAFKEAERDLAELGGPTTKEYIESAKRIEESQHRLGVGWGYLKQALSAEMFPAFDGLIRLTTKAVVATIAFVNHTSILKTGLDALAFAAGIKTVTSLAALASKFGLLKPSILETVAAMARFAIPLLLVGLLYAAFDELYNLMTGHRSVIGDALDEFGGLGTAEQAALDLNDALHNTYDVLRDIYKITHGAVAGVVAQLSEIERQTEAGEFDPGKVSEAGHAGAKEMVDAVTDIGDSFSRVHDTPERRQMVERRNYRRAVGQGWAQMGPDFDGPVYVPGGASAGWAPPAAEGTGTVVHQKNETNVHVTTASDTPKAHGEAVAAKVATAQEKANNNAFNSPSVRRK